MAALARAVDRGQDLDAVLSSVLALIAASLDAGLVFLARPEGDTLHIARALDPAGMGLRAGDAIPLDDTYCQTLLAGDAPTLVVKDARADPHFADLATTRALGIGSYSGVRLAGPDGQPYGTLCALHPAPRAVSPGEVTLLELAGRLLTQALALDEGRAREQALRAERDAAAQARAIYGALACGVLTLDARGRIADINAIGATLLGVAPDDARGQLLSAALRETRGLDGAALPQEKRPAVAALRTGRTQRATVQISGRDGGARWLQVDAVPLPDDGAADDGAADDGAARVIVSYIDVTTRVLLERDLAQGQQRYRSLVHHNPDAVFALAPDGALTAVNAAGAALTGYTGAELLTLSFPALIASADLPRAADHFARAVAGTPQRDVELGLRRRDGADRAASVTAIPIVVDGAVVGVYGIAKDVTAQRHAERALRASEERFRSLARVAPDAIISADGAGVIASWNEGAERLFGYAEDEALGRPLTLLMPERFREAHQRGLERATTTGSAALVGRTIEITGRRRAGDEFPLELSLAMWATAEGHFYSAIIRDITDRKRAEEALRASEEDYRHLFEQANDAILIIDPVGDVVLDVNERACALYGRPRDAFIGTRMADLARDIPARDHRARAARAGWGASEFESVHRRADGTPFAVAISATPITFGGRAAVLSFNRDITARKEAEAAARHAATHDALTDLPNRALLDEHLAALTRAASPESADRAGPSASANRAATGIPALPTPDAAPCALLLLNLDGFREVNDTFGHPLGDALLRQVAGRVRGALRASDLVARLGGDEFAAVLAGGDVAAATRAAAGIRAALEAPFVVEGQTLHIGGSIGIALYPDHGAEGTALLRRADIALYAAKHGRRGAAVYDPADDGHSPARLALVGDLRAAIAGDALALHYQPQVDIASGRVRGVEALARWPHPTRGLIPPDAFIPLAERTGLIGPLTRWALATALRQWRAWRRDGLLLTLSVNLSVWDLHDAALPDLIAGLLGEHGVPPAWLRLELTEGTLMADPDRALAVLDRLHGLGVGLAVDDFGAAYSSLAYLKRLPVDELKIDKGFVRALATDARDAAIVASTVGLGHALGLRVVAEGIEDAASWERLAAMGCDTAQGYYLSRPLAADALTRWLRASPWAVA